MENEKIRQPARAIIGHCPKCRQVIIIENNYETWPLVVCKCGWTSDTHGLENKIRHEPGGIFYDDRD